MACHDERDETRPVVQGEFVEGTEIAGDLDMGEGSGFPYVEKKGGSGVSSENIVFVFLSVLARMVEGWGRVASLVRAVTDTRSLCDGDEE
jgi:hypothetical protein